MAMDFFEHQERARRKTGLLVVYFLLAVVCIFVAVYAAVALTLVGVDLKQAAEPGVAAAGLFRPELLLGVLVATVVVVGGGSLYKIAALSSGGESVARMLGGRPVDGNTTDVHERRLINVVEEMALASGTAVPPVFVMDGERGINAFAAGYSPDDAVIGVTHGCITQLNRDEMQGVIGHEFSHMLNGDMRLNIRLMGVLHGILLIGVIGFFVFRSSLYTGGFQSRRSRERGGNRLPIVVLGLILCAVGYIGVFFGKLIKSAVSRQREFLADASSVQFTRNPAGLAGALTKIGGFAAGSRLATPRAEESSHMFFSNALRGSLSSLLATHPPLSERIRRLDPSFDGESRRSGRPAPEAGAQALTSGLAAGPPPIPGRVAVRTAEVVASVGTVDDAHLRYAAGLVASLPAALREQVRDPYTARAVVYGLLIDERSDVQGKQLARLANQETPGLVRDVRELLPVLARLGAETRIPLVDLTMPALRRLSDAQYASFRRNVTALVKADAQIDLFEYTLQLVLFRRLDIQFGRVRPVRPDVAALKGVRTECNVLLSTLAHIGGGDETAVNHAFKQGTSGLDLRGELLALMSADQCAMDKVDAALKRLVRLTPGLKKRVVAGCVACIAADGYVTVDEAELLRAVSASLDCPLPPFLSN